MSETVNPFINNLKESPGIRLSVLFGSFFIMLILTSIISMVIDRLPIGTERDHILATSVVQCILAFCLPAYLLAKFSSNRPAEWLKLTTPLAVKPLVGVLIVYVITLPAMEWLIEWNAGLHLPESMASLEQTLRGWEESNGATSQTILASKGWFPMWTGVLIIGILTGFSEELFFRSGLQGIFSRTAIGSTTAIWLAAIIFSSMHFQFFGFVPRLLMGVFFGYLLVWTSDVKISAFAHILNNSMVVIMASMTDAEDLTNPESSLLPEVPYLPLISVILTVAFLVFCRDYFFKNKDIKSLMAIKSRA